MTTIPFTPNQTSSPPFQATVTLDGNTYSLIAMWNIAGQRYYISLVGQGNNLLINQPLIGSPPDADIYLAPGMLTNSALVYRVETQSFEIGP